MSSVESSLAAALGTAQPWPVMALAMGGDVAPANAINSPINSDAAADRTMPDNPVTFQTAVARTVAAMNYELVDIERTGGGTLRVTIDRLPGQAYPTGESEVVVIDDCEAVTRQLQFSLEVDGIDYKRLEVSSPGLDRPLKKEADYARFVGEAAEVTLRVPLQGRKKFRGVLQARDGGWRLVLDDSLGMPYDPKTRLGKKAAAAKADPALAKTLDFSLDEVREARLVAVVDFKGRPAKKAGAIVGGLDT